MKRSVGDWIFDSFNYLFLGLLGLAAWMAWLAPRHKTPGIAPRN